MPEAERKKVVWIDDDAHAMESQMMRLNAAGFDVVQIPTIDEAYRVLSADGYSADLVVLDVMMATGSFLEGEETNGGLKTGIAFIEKVAKEELLDRYKWVFYTITDGDEMRQIGRRFGIQGFKKQNYPGKAIVELISGQLEEKGD